MTPTVTRVSTDQRLGCRHARASSNTTRKPSPPTITAVATVRQIHGSLTNRMARRPRRPATSTVNRVANVMIPSPAITTSPKTDQCDSVSTTTRPVMQTADVAVNSAASQPADSPVVVAIGRVSRSVPSPMAPPNPVATT